MKRIVAVLAFILTVSSAFAQTGLVVREIEVPHHEHTMTMAIFYPSADGTVSNLGENGVFYGVDVVEDAKPVVGKHPVILLSHGWGGNFQRMGWLSKGLADHNAIVIAVNHPDSTSGQLGSLHALDHWTRAQDLSAILDSALADPQFAAVIDSDHIYAAGFSYGGWTALSLGGLKGRRDGLDGFCNDKSHPISHCADILKAGIKIADIDQGKWDASYKDPRIKAVAAIDPGLTWGLHASDTAALDVPVLLIGLGTGPDRLHATDTSAAGSNFETLVPAARVEHIVPATHFTALGICKPKGAEILAEEKDDPVCTDPAGTDRRKVTDTIIQLMASHFKLD